MDNNSNLRQWFKLKKNLHINHVTPSKFQYVNELENFSSFQQSTFVKAVPVTMDS